MTLGTPAVASGEVQFAADLPAALVESLRRAGLDTLAGAFDFQAGQDLQKPGLGQRRRTRLTVTADGMPWTLYLKRYGRPSVGQRMRQLASGRRTSPAQIEFENVRLARMTGVATMRPVAYAHDMGLTGAGRSFVLVSAVPGDALERVLPERLAAEGLDGRMGRPLAEALADLAGRLHAARLFHRDLYASHIFLAEENDAAAQGSPDDDAPAQVVTVGGAGLRLYLIDLARMVGPWVRPRRWQVKDIAQLRYSLASEWVGRWWPAFLERYLTQAPAAQGRRAFERDIERKIGEMCRRDARRARRGRRT